MRALFVCLLLLPLLAPAAAEEGLVPVRRFALLVGVNDGGPSRVRLRYAISDAEAVSQVLGELGGVLPGDRLLVLEADRAALEEGLKRLREMLSSARSSSGRTEALLYYSGHSDEEGLLLKRDRYSYRELRQALNTLPADVRIAIVDSCASGSLTRQKDGGRWPAFRVDSSASVRGYAILTSSSENEVSQESDRLGGSYFTHNLVSGLRGAADQSGDGRVTLNEAYQFAFQETLARTEKTRDGAQHPAYDIDLTGTVDLVLTEPHPVIVSRGGGEEAQAAGNVLFRVEVYGSDVHAAHVALKLGSPHIYTVFTGGHGSLLGGTRRWSMGLGVGGHVPLERWFIDVDVVGHSFHQSAEGPCGNRLLAQFRVIAGWQVVPRFAVFAGPTFNVLTSLDGQPVQKVSFLFGEGEGSRVMWPGLHLGVRL